MELLQKLFLRRWRAGSNGFAGPAGKIVSAGWAGFENLMTKNGTFPGFLSQR